MTLKLSENVIIQGIIQAQTGLHIGGSKDSIQIGAVDSPVIRDLRSGLPLIPGSSLKGKMRSSIELALGRYDTRRDGGFPHSSISTCEFGSECEVCVVFGSTNNPDVALTRLIVRDAPAMSDKALETEIKTENTIDRIQGKSQSGLRHFERVPAGTDFKLELVYSIFDHNNDRKYLQKICESLLLIEDSYLGGSGSRGYGKVVFKITKVTRKSVEDYQNNPEGKDIIDQTDGIRVHELATHPEFAKIIQG